MPVLFDKFPYHFHQLRNTTFLIAVIGVVLFLLLYVLAALGLSINFLFGAMVLAHLGHFFLWAAAGIVRGSVCEHPTLIFYTVLGAVTLLGDLAALTVRAIEISFCGRSLICGSVEFAASWVCIILDGLLVLISGAQLAVMIMLTKSTKNYRSDVKVANLYALHSQQGILDVEVPKQAVDIVLKDIGLRRRKKRSDRSGYRELETEEQKEKRDAIKDDQEDEDDDEETEDEK